MPDDPSAISRPVVRPPAGWRASYTTFIDRHEVAWELGVAGLAVVFLFVGFIEDDRSSIASLIEIGLTGVFIAEVASRFVAAPSRSAYLNEPSEMEVMRWHDEGAA